MLKKLETYKLERGECLTSFDVTALYTSIPVTDALEIIKRILEQDTGLPRRSTWSSENIQKLLEFCLVNTYFLFNGQFFEQTKGAAMGSPVSPIVANIYMEAFEERALSTALHPQKIWKRYVDDTSVVQLQSQRDEFFHHISQVDTSIKFTMEETGPNGSIPFLDLLITPEADGTLTTKLYRKPTHPDQYLQWDSNHNLASKYSVINTLTHRAKTLCSTPDSTKQELEHLEKALMGCKYPRWATQKVLHKQTYPKTNKKKQHPRSQKKVCHMVVPYSKGIAKSFKNICRKYGVQVYFKGGKILKNLLVSPKDKDNIKKKSNVIYWLRCDKIDCKEEYIGESSRTFEEGYKEHLKAPSPIYEHQDSTGHITSVENFKIIGREDHNMARAIKDTIYIRVNNPTLNRNNGKYNLPHLWDGLLAIHPRTENKPVMILHCNICATRIIMPCTITPVHKGQIIN